jgi:hypothetical protein
VDRNRQTWTLGTDLGIWWEFGGNLVELSEPDYQVLNIRRWEFGGNLVGIWWEFGRGFGSSIHFFLKKSIKMFFSTKIVFYICYQET